MANKEKLISLVKSHLSEGEVPELGILGTYETKLMGSDTVRSGVLVATPKRLVFFAKKLTGFDFESFPYDHISSFERSKNMMGGSIRFIASGNTVGMKWINDADLLRFVELVQARMEKKPSQEPTEVIATVTIPEQIAALAALRDSGILTEDEFQGKKLLLLDRL